MMVYMYRAVIPYQLYLREVCGVISNFVKTQKYSKINFEFREEFHQVHKNICTFHSLLQQSILQKTKSRNLKTLNRNQCYFIYSFQCRIHSFDFLSNSDIRNIQMKLYSSPKPSKIIKMIPFLLLIIQAHSSYGTITPSETEIILMQTGQYHFIPLGSFFQYSIAGWQQEVISKYIKNITINYKVQILSPNPRYNFLALYTDSNNVEPYDKFNCYVRAINEGIQNLMSDCNIPMNNFSNGFCNSSISQAAPGLFSSSNTFFNCSDINFTYNISSKDSVGPLNGTLLMIIDNSGLFPISPKPNSQIKLIQSYQVIVTIDGDEKAKLYLFAGLTFILIIILIIIAATLTYKTKKLDRQISTSKRQKTE